MEKLANTDLEVFPLCLGGNVFGWTAGREDSFAVLDSYASVGGNFIDTADVYMQRIPGNRGGESETMIGEWLASRGGRDRMVLATKVGNLKGREGLSAANIKRAADDSLRRLRTDYIDLYYAHSDDPDTPLEETLGAFDELVREGKVRHIAASNYTASRLSEALAVSGREGLARYAALQPHYNLLERGYEGELSSLVFSEGLAALPYYGLAKGFLTGKYRPGREDIESQRAGRARAYLDSRGKAVLEALDEISAARGTTVAAVSLAWLAARHTVAAPIASARNTEQLSRILPFAELKLSDEEMRSLDAASDATSA